MDATDASKGTATESPAPKQRSNFIRSIIDADLEAGTHDGKVLTRFPPEPNGFLHIGHAKAICLNFGLGRDYNGACNLRFDDTNPTTEDTIYVKSIQADVRWLGFDWPGEACFASSYFEQMYRYAVELIEKGLAYVCSLDREAMREYRGTPHEPGKDSPYRDRSIQENLALFAQMRAGEFPEGSHTLRAKIDMASPNLIMRDPPLYRIRHASHHRTGDSWCIYPMYDFAHCLEDAIEGITHSICTLEFENNRELYDWLLERVSVPARPRQYEFARLNLDYTVMSKRKLLQLVQEGHVIGWDDPRMPTLAGLRRRGVRAEAIRAFCDLIGVAKTNSVVDIGKLEYCIRDDLNTVAPRVMCVLRPLKVIIDNFPADHTEELDAPYFPHDVGKEGSRTVPLSRELYIERDDFHENPPKKWHRLAPGREVRLRYGYFIRCERVEKDPTSGEILALHCSYDPETRGGSAPDGRKVRGTLHWVSAEHALPLEVRLYDRLFKVPRPGTDPETDFRSELNLDSLEVLQGAVVEPSVANAEPGTRFQFERQGYFVVDTVDSKAEAMVVNRIVGLRDSWAKKQPSPSLPKARKDPEKAGLPKKAAAQSSEAPKSSERKATREATPVLAARYLRYQQELGLSEADADLLSGDLPLSDFFEAGLVAHDKPGSVARWMVNEVLRALKDSSVEALPFSGAAVGKLAGLVDAERVTAPAAKQIFGELAEHGGEPEAIMGSLGLERDTDADALGALLDELLAAHPDELQRYRGGEKQLFGFFMGQAMRASRGKAAPAEVRSVLGNKLEDA